MKKPVQVFNFSFQNKSANKVEVHIDGDIVDAGTQSVLENIFGDNTTTSYKSFRNEINKLTFDELDVIINSSGGHVGDAMAMHDYISDLQTKQGKIVNTIGRGIVASSATLILLAGKKPTMSENSMFLMHEVSGGAYGTVTQVENYAKSMRKFNNQIRDLYANKSGKSATEIDNLMKEETWLNAKDAEGMGFVAATPTVPFANKIEKESWPFANTEILNSYNNNVENPSNNTEIQELMKQFKNLAQDIKNALKGKNIEEATVNAIAEAVAKPLENIDIEEIVNKAVDVATKPLKAQIKKLTAKAKPDDEEENEDDLEEGLDELEEGNEEETEDGQDPVENKDKGKKKPVSIEARLAAIEKENKQLKADLKNKIGGKSNSKEDPKNKVVPIGGYN